MSHRFVVHPAPLPPWARAQALAWAGAAVMACTAAAAWAQPAQSTVQAAQTALLAAQTALQQQEWAAAELWLERALLLDPDNIEARQEWAQLLLRRGERDTARALLDSLRPFNRLPPPQAQAMQALWAAAQAPAARPGLKGSAEAPGPQGQAASSALGSPAQATPTGPWRSQAEAFWGHSRNPLVQPAAQDVVLTLPQGNLVLPLASNAQPGSVWGLRAATSHTAGWVLQGQLQGVAGQGVPSVRLGGLYAATAHWGLFAHAQRLADSTRRTQAGLQGAYPLWGSQPWGLVRQATVLLQASAYTEPEAPRQGLAQRATVLASLGGGWQALAWAEHESNRLAEGPPGARSAGLVGEYRYQKHFSFTLQVVDQQDIRGYSLLLNNNAPRRLKTATTQLEWALAKGLESGPVLRLHAGRRHSNLPLFAWEDAGVALVWRQAW